MTVSQKLNHLNDENYDDDITVTDVPKGQFIAVTSVTLPDGSTTREITVTLMSMPVAEGGTNTTNSGLWIKQAAETAVKVTVVNEGGQEQCSNTTNY